MTQYKAGEKSIWNKVLYGVPREPVKDDVSEKPLQAGEFKNEKLLVSESPEVKQSGSLRRKLELVIYGFLALSFFAHYNLLPSRRSLFSGLTNIEEPDRSFRLLQEGSFLQDESATNATKEVIEVSYPFVPSSDYGVPVFSSILIQHEFGQSWGSPASNKFVPPTEVEFNRVVLTLNVTSNGVQYDRLGNIFVDGVQIWRTSTAEPANGSISSSFVKDVSPYLSLFEKNSTVLFQLDNILNSKLTGKFNVTLTADLYFVNKTSSGSSNFDTSAAGNSAQGDTFFFDKPAASVLSLTGSGKADKPSLAYLPSDKISVQLPTVPVNTTRLKLAIFASGNAAEEFWYSNLLDAFEHQFESHGKKFHGHGPLRIVNVYFNGEKIATQSPEPFVFTGGISPALWSPVVSIDAFDLPSIDLDVTALLPYLWESQAIEDKVLEIEVSNGLDETLPPAAPRSKISENWITSANLLTYESDKVVSASGEVVGITSGQNATSFGIAPPFSGMLQQIVTSNFSASISSNFSYELIDGTYVNVTYISKTATKGANVQSYKKFGDSQRVVSIMSNKNSIQVFNQSADATVPPTLLHDITYNVSYPIVLNLTELDMTKVPGDVEVEYEVDVSLAKKVDMKVDDLFKFKNSVKQNGTSSYFVAAKGNSGFGSLDTKYKLKYSAGIDSVDYKRTVTAVNGTITSDVTTPALEAQVVNVNADQSSKKKCHHSNIFSLFENEKEYLQTILAEIQMNIEVPKVSNRYPPMKSRKFKSLVSTLST